MKLDWNRAIVNMWLCIQCLLHLACAGLMKRSTIRGRRALTLMEIWLRTMFPVARSGSYENTLGPIVGDM